MKPYRYEKALIKSFAEEWFRMGMSKDAFEQIKGYLTPKEQEEFMEYLNMKRGL